MANSSSIQQMINLHARCSCWKKEHHIFYFPCINFSSFLEVHLVKLVIISYIQCCEIILIQFHNCSKEFLEHLIMDTNIYTWFLEMVINNDISSFSFYMVNYCVLNLTQRFEVWIFDKIGYKMIFSLFHQVIFLSACASMIFGRKKKNIGFCWFCIKRTSERERR